MLSIVYCTARKNPRYDLLYSSLKTSSVKHPTIKFEVIIISLNCPALDVPIPDFTYSYNPPKPTPWQGVYKLCKENMWAKCNALNTGTAKAKGEQIVYLDDSMFVDEDFLLWHSSAAGRGLALAGQMKSVTGFIVTEKEFRYQPYGQPDARASHPPGLCPGNFLFGSNMSVPTKWVFKINGHDEAFDGERGLEDIDFGIRLQRSGCPVIYAPECLVYQILEDHDAAPNSISGGQYNNRALMQALANNTTRFTPVAKQQDLISLRDEEKILPNSEAKDWRTGKLIKDL